MNTPTVITIAAVGGLAFLVLLGLVLRRAAPPMAIAAEDTSADELPIVPSAAPGGRHHVDTVQHVRPDYMPAIGRRRIAAETDTQRIDWPRS